MTRDWGPGVTQPLPDEVHRLAVDAVQSMGEALRGLPPTQPETPAAELARRWAALGTDEAPEEETEPWE